MGVPEGRPSRGVDERIVGGRVIDVIFAFFFAFRLVSAAFCSALSTRGAMSEASEFLNRSLFNARFLQANSEVSENKNTYYHGAPRCDGILPVFLFTGKHIRAHGYDHRSNL